MRVTGLGHASVLIETEFGSVLTDPWVNPAYFGSWFPFPDNSQLDWDTFGDVDYLFVSHLHRDHFDPEHLERYVSKKATVLLPNYPTSELEDQLRELGFSSFVRTRNDEVIDLDGLQVMINSLISPTDGPIGDSSLWLSDGRHTLLNQNDARPSDLTSFTKLGHVDAHLLQFSGAIWFPMVYDLPKRAKQALGATKRERQFDRSLRYIDDLQASYVFPTAGPPCFLDEELWGFNDIFGDESNIFPDQKVYLDWLAERGRDNGRLLLPGTVAAPRRAGLPGGAPDLRRRGGQALRRQARLPARHGRPAAARGGAAEARPGPIPRSTCWPSSRPGSPRCWRRPTRWRPASTAGSGSPPPTTSAATSTSCSTSSPARCVPTRTRRSATGSRPSGSTWSSWSSSTRSTG